jgi:transcriptional regulator with AAA-type ATPase domain
MSMDNIDEFIKKFQLSEPKFLESNCSRELLLNNYNYILTEKAKERLDKLYTYISKGIPVLLEGETGSSKTLSTEIICKFIYEKNQYNKNKK